MNPLLTLLDAVDQSDRDAKLSGHLAKGPSGAAKAKYLRNIRIPKFCARMLLAFTNATTVSILQSAIFRAANPSEVGRPIIRTVPVDVVDSGEGKLAINKRLRHQPVQVDAIYLPKALEIDTMVAVGCMASQNTPPPQLRWLPFSFAGSEIIKAAHSTLVRYLDPPFISGCWFPYLIHGLRLVGKQGGCNCFARRRAAEAAMYRGAA
ncbi:hypothetical protein GGR43_004497 [Sphingobium jiangsuense]|uniref:Uncharacterized protein n=1 Tax=Sphingobium jiangsuense TaxID=870476 RepID=A0A7W6FSH2_9SPHN|nr:hypothetical protein [Sphingobium jiangsuense]MBB3928752.1 hypothetical protein [Sphingobium jiangsuense]